MREIKFRAWLTNSDGITYSNGSHMEYNITLVDGKYADVEGSWDIQGTRDYPIMQYTGLKDKNGKEIYEGDIINEGLYISWCDKCKQYQVFNCLNDCMACGGDIHWYETISKDYNKEVIGNIYENPELLNK